ncbi:hypothetical protein AJ78_06190 [Emergomyces pasteurianus Ep9510]|uniref:Uncharacterized protein n=1 Tax=Emergomyces pasteurianus Ep9510 TaxID=1447872 RepID=A0A1J9PBC5_9EURO|nr:hypothetical protein AJ78_06190 [Emergomyces pasteurianus Ep9510]
MAERPTPWDDFWEEAYASPESSVGQPDPAYCRENDLEELKGLQKAPMILSPYGPRLGTKWEPVPPSSPLRQEWDTILKARVLEILAEYQIDLQSSHFIYYLTENSTETTSPPNITTLIRATAKETEQEWIPVLGALRRYYLSVNKPEITIELRDERACESTQCYPVESSEAVVPIWNNDVERQMILKLRGRDWLTLSLFRRGKPSRPKPLVVVLTVLKASTRDWVSIREEFVQLLDSYDLRYVAVEILRGEKVFGNANEDDRIPLTDDAFTKGMSMGRSIGPRGSRNHASTFGGFVKLQNLKGDWHTFGLACFHSVAPDGCGHPSLGTWQREGIAIDDKTNDRDGFTDTFQEIERRLNDPNDLVTPGEKAKFMVKRTLFGQDEERLGKVYAASGDRQSNSRAVDWALIEVDESRITNNRARPPPSSSTLQYPIFKRINLMRGVLNGDVECLMVNTSEPYSSPKQAAIFPRSILNAEFGTRSDSGSFVLDSSGNFAGLYFGGIKDLCGVGFFTSAADLIKDIKRVTEAKDVRFDV